MTVRIFDVEIYRDGGSIEFIMECDGALKHIRLDTPFRGEPRALLVNSVSVSRGAPEVRRLLDGIEEWWRSLSTDLQGKALEALAHKKAFYDPTAEMLEAIDVSRVLYCRDYVVETYLA